MRSPRNETGVHPDRRRLKKKVAQPLTRANDSSAPADESTSDRAETLVRPDRSTINEGGGGNQLPKARLAPRAWSGWRGPDRDGRVPWLPPRLPENPRRLWEAPLGSPGLGGVAATSEFVVVSDRALEDTTDLYRCLRADTGEEVWQFTNPALGQLDYGNSPRTTPLIVDGLVFLQGAFGQLHCLELATGNLVWQIDLIAEFGVDPVPTWGTCSSPLLANGKLIVNPGAAAASLVALNPKSGDVIWKTAGAAAGYGSLIVARLGGRLQVIGHDTDSLGGWDVEDGRRLWQLKPPIPRDFNVPTPVVAGEHLVVCTENNGTRMFRFREQGVIDPRPVATYGDLAPDTQSPVVVGRRLFGGGAGLHCLDLDQQLKPRWTTLDDPYLAHVNILASDERLLVTTLEGELLLVDARSDRYSLVSRVSVFSGEAGVYAHPALVGSRLYVRGNSSLVCLDLGE